MLKKNASNKLPPNALTQINSMVRKNVKVSLTKMLQANSNNESFNIFKSTKSRGGNILRYNYKLPQRTVNLSDIQN